ncbi:MAG: hypothetical protein DRP85_03960 [Candidatus Makaraimicrobium thalassicum]|nr:MAG: hypothetical protein DRP85_03960 [Candidatus Omnitrophota bacterium]
MLTYEDSLKYLDSFVNYEEIGFAGLKKDFNLNRLSRALKGLGYPHRGYRSVHVAGTKGKGSICTFTSSILQSAGCRVGLFTSPHLITPAERIKINNRTIGKTDLVHILDHLRGYLGRDAAEKFTLFEMYTLIAVLYFSMKKVDFAVFEAGMGGRLDATNVIDAEVCCISPVSYDHTQVLGKRIGQIAREKAAIIKRNAHCVSSPQRASVLRVIRDRCAGEGASLSLVGRDITYRVDSCDEKGSRFDVYGRLGRYEKCRVNMPGDFQISNCAAAVGICERVLGRERIDEDAFKKGIGRAFIPGRMEILCRRPFVIIDGAQNGDSAERLKYSVEQIFRYDKLILLLGLSRDKNIKSVCRQLVPFADEIVLTRASVDRAADPYLIRGYIKGRRVRVTENVKESLGTAFHLAKKDDMILATGSFFVISEIRKMILGNPARAEGEHDK